MAYLKTILIAFLCLPATIHAAESPADTINMVLQSLSKGDISPLIARLSDTDRKEFQGVRSQPGLQYIKDNLNLPSEVTSGWGEYEYRVANDYIRDWGVVKSKKDPGLEKTYQQAYVRDQWVQGDYAEVDLVFPMSGFKYPPGLIRFVLFKESGVWRISHLGSIFMTASMMIPPMRSVNPFVLGDYADFCFSYVYGDNFAKIQYGAPELEKFSMYRRLRAISAAVSAKAVSYVASGAVTAPAGGRKKKLIYDEKGNPVGEMKYDLSHKRSKKNPYLAMSPENQLLMLGNPFMPAGQAYIHFSEKFKADTALAAKAMGVAGAAYMRSENFEKAAEAYEVAAAGSDPAERMAAKKALVDIYMNRLRQPKKAEQHQRDLETSGLVPEYDRLQVAAPETLLVRSEPETKRLVDFEVGADSETLYLLFHEGHYKDSPNWVESTVVEYRIYGSSKVISSVRNERIDSSSFFYLGKGEDGLWIYGNGGHGYKINYAGNLQKYFSDARTSVVYNTPQEKFLKFPNMSWSGMMSANGLLYGLGGFDDYSNADKSFFGLRVFDETTGKGKAGFIEPKRYSSADIRKKAEKVVVASADVEEILVYDLKKLQRKCLKGDPPSSSLSAAEGMSADADGNLYVSLSDRKVFVFSKEGAKQREFETGDILPLHIGMDAKKQIYLAGPVGNGSRAGIRIFSATGKKVSGFDFEAPESGDGRFFVRNLRITSKGTVFVNIGNKAVRRYSSNGTELDRWERKTDGNIHLAPDNATDSLYVFDGRNAYLYKGTATVKLAEPKLSAIYMAEMSGDAEGRIHGYDFHSGIFFFDPKTGKPEFKPENANNMDLVSRKLLVDVADNLWVISGPVLRKLSPEGKELVNIKINGRKLRAPISIDYDAWGNFIVADRNNKRIMRYNRKGEKISDIDVSPFADSIDKIRMDKHNNLYLLRGDKWGGRKEILFRFNGLFAKED